MHIAQPRILCLLFTASRTATLESIVVDQDPFHSCLMECVFRRIAPFIVGQSLQTIQFALCPFITDNRTFSYGWSVAANSMPLKITIQTERFQRIPGLFCWRGPPVNTQILHVETDSETPSCQHGLLVLSQLKRSVAGQTVTSLIVFIAILQMHRDPFYYAIPRSCCNCAVTGRITTII